MLLDRVIVGRLSLEVNATEGKGYWAALSAHKAQPSSVEETSSFHYLLHVWKAAASIKRSLNRQRYGDRFETLEALQALCVSYAGLLLQFPDMFPQPPTVQERGAALVVESIIEDADSDREIPEDFLAALVDRFNDDNLMGVFGPILTGLSAKMRLQTLSTSFMPPLRTMVRLMAYKPLASSVVTLPSFNPAGTTARTMEVLSLLGPFFRLSVFGNDQPQFASSQFGLEHQRNRQNVESVFISMRMAMQSVHEAQYHICMALIRASPESKEALLQWFATVIKRNEDRGKMHIADPNNVSTEGFMSNLFIVLLKMSEPIMGLGFPKSHLIDPNYFLLSKRLDISKLTKLNATPDEEKEYFDGEAMDVLVCFQTDFN